MSIIRQLLSNYVLMSAFASWGLAQLLKLPLNYAANKEWDWKVLFNPGGMPSSHSAISTSASLAIGLQHGFDSSLYALSVVLMAIVVYDATSVRRQAGIHAEWINKIMEEMEEWFTSGNFSYKKLQEVLGHTPFEAMAGITLGLFVSLILWFAYYRN